MKQYIEVASTSLRDLVDQVLKLGAVGVTIDETCPVHKLGPVFAARLVTTNDSKVEYNGIVVKGFSVADDTPEPVVASVPVKEGKSFTREELEVMSLAEIRKATGLKTGGKQELIDQYLASDSHVEEENKE